MKNFQEFLTESISQKDIDTDNLSYDDFLEQVKKSYMRDFDKTERQALEFTILYRSLLKDAWTKGYDVREAIASTKIPGVLVDDESLEESLHLSIDDFYEETMERIKAVQSKEEMDVILNGYYEALNVTYSDNRVFERVKNTYKKLREYASKKAFESANSVEVDVIDRNDDLIGKIIANLSIVYKKRKDRQTRPVKIAGKTTIDDVDLEIIMSNKDLIRLIHTKDDQLKIAINGKVVYDMDTDGKGNIVSVLARAYEDYLKEKKFKIKKQGNPFEQ